MRVSREECLQQAAALRGKGLGAAGLSRPHSAEGGMMHSSIRLTPEPELLLRWSLKK